jgi:hypothetical protein
MTSDDERALVQAERNLEDVTSLKPLARPSFTTPGKRKYTDRFGGNGLPTPETNNKRTWTSRTADSNADELLDLVSPQTTPTPASRFKDAVSDGTALWAEIDGIIAADHVAMGDSTRVRLESACNAYARKSKGVLQAYVSESF